MPGSFVLSRSKTQVEAIRLFRVYTNKNTVAISDKCPKIHAASWSGILVEHPASEACKEHNLDTEGMNIEVSYDTAQHPTRFENILVKLDLPNAHCDDECTAKALEHVAKHCPVHETIMTLEKVMFEITTNEQRRSA